MENKKSWRSLLLYLGIPIVIIIIIVLVIGNMPQKTMKYSEILNYFETQQVTEFDLDLGSGAMVLTLNDGDESKKKEPTQIQYSVPNVTILYEDIKPYIEEYNKDRPFVRGNRRFLLDLYEKVCRYGYGRRLQADEFRQGENQGYERREAQDHLCRCGRRG